MNSLVLSVLLCVVSAVAYAAAAILQERVAADASGVAYAPTHSPRWWAAVSLNGLGAVLHVVALAFGPLSLVQPLGALTIVFALPLAALFAGRRTGPAAWRGAVMATLGLAGLLSLTDMHEAESLGGTDRVLLALSTAGVLTGLLLAGHAVHRHPAVRAGLLATAAGVAYGMASVFVKSVAVGDPLEMWPSMLVIAALAAGGLLISQASYRGAGLHAPLATLTVVNPVVAAAVGIAFFGESFRYGWTGTVLALGSGAVAAGGLILLTAERLTTPAVPSQREKPQKEEPDPPASSSPRPVELSGCPGPTWSGSPGASPVGPPSGIRRRPRGR